MKKPLKIVILAVTKTYDRYCIAGMTEYGKWVRPLPPDHRFWETYTYDDQTFIKPGDVWEITDYIKYDDPQSPGHTEDIKVLNYNSVYKCNELNDEQLCEFVEQRLENEQSLNDTLNANGRSLCLIKVDGIRKVVGEQRVCFTMNGREYRNNTFREGYPVTDLKWRSIFQHHSVSFEKFNKLYLCVGLARKEPNKGIEREYPMIISIITNPFVPYPPQYPY
ncbi:dual OB domain-containing protein [Parageobacillus thermoglucosidasius]|uniref:dual OB domain-containing protein n=1 Tax=Parageobacillus thermoglucosidasius TaxID=1426 RepID=UPI0027E93667|nr:hypothetical protein PthstB1num2_19010 [Parageobacillus thermoglucosidasius]